MKEKSELGNKVEKLEMQLKKSIKNVTQNISKILIFVSKVVDVIK